jgi:hypothetical protein
MACYTDSFTFTTQTRKKLRGLSPQANYAGEVSANFCGEGATWSAWRPYDRILGFLERSRYFFFQVAPQLYS